MIFGLASRLIEDVGRIDALFQGPLAIGSLPPFGFYDALNKAVPLAKPEAP